MTTRTSQSGLDGWNLFIAWLAISSRQSAEWFHDEDWLDFNMRQDGHLTEFTGNYPNTLKDYPPPGTRR